MLEYQLEIKQVVDYPRCRIYRQFIQTLMEDRNIRTGGGSGLFYYTVLCNYANFRTSYRRIDGISYIVYPGEWTMLRKGINKMISHKIPASGSQHTGRASEESVDFPSYSGQRKGC